MPPCHVMIMTLTQVTCCMSHRYTAHTCITHQHTPNTHNKNNHTCNKHIAHVWTQHYVTCHTSTHTHTPPVMLSMNATYDSTACDMLAAYHEGVLHTCYVCFKCMYMYTYMLTLTPTHSYYCAPHISISHHITTHASGIGTGVGVVRDQPLLSVYHGPTSLVPCLSLSLLLGVFLCLSLCTCVSGDPTPHVLSLVFLVCL